MAYPNYETDLNLTADHLQNLEMTLNSLLYRHTKYHPENPKQWLWHLTPVPVVWADLGAVTGCGQGMAF